MEKKSRSNFCDAFCIIGFPDELGIQNLNGRTGSKAGPAVFFEYFQKLNGKNPVREKMKVFDSVPMVDNLEKNYLKASATVSAHASGSLVVGIGGGHDYAYPWLRGLLESKKAVKPKFKLGCINIDAHFDLREYQPKMTSGSPFRRLLDEKILEGRHLVEFGIQDHCNAPELWDFAKKQKIKTVPFSQLRHGSAVAKFKKSLSELRKVCDEVVISLDLDAISLAYCPGVSAPQGEGFTASEVYQMLEIAATDKKVTSLGVFELSPPLDLNHQTARVAAQATWHFLNSKFF